MPSDPFIREKFTMNLVLACFDPQWPSLKIAVTGFEA
jgi:hypothetical protein